MWRSLGVLVALALPAEPAFAEHEFGRRFLFFSGVELSTLSVFGWAGVDAPLGPSRDVSGPILRVTGGAGHYDYEKSGAPDGRVIGNVMMGEALAGWRHIGTSLCLSVLGGFAIENHVIDVPDPGNRVQGTETGAKLMTELFWRPSPHTHIEAQASYATTFDFWRARLAGGYILWRGVVVGPEAEAFGNIGSEQVRLGIHASEVGWRDWRFKAALGALHDGKELGAYGRFGVDLSF